MKAERTPHHGDVSDTVTSTEAVSRILWPLLVVVLPAPAKQRVSRPFNSSLSLLNVAVPAEQICEGSAAIQ